MIPVATELRAVWDAMKPQYQAVLAAPRPPAAAADAMQRDALEKIRQMHQQVTPTFGSIAVQLLGLAAARRAGSSGSAIRSFVSRATGVAIRSRICTCCRPRSLIFAVIIFPLGYNIVLSLSNMSLLNFRDWQIVGLQNYAEVFTDPKLGAVLLQDARLDRGQRRVSSCRSACCSPWRCITRSAAAWSISCS